MNVVHGGDIETGGEKLVGPPMVTAYRQTSLLPSIRHWMATGRWLGKWFIA